MKKITKIEPAAATKKKRKRRVAAYCRVSTATEDQLVSLEAQKAHYVEYITAHSDWEYAGLYFDEGISGTKKEIRPALMKLIADCEDGKVEYIVTKSLSRFARNTTDCLELIRKLLVLGVAVYFEKEKLDTGSMESELLLSIMSSFAESESVSISENEKWSIRNRFENGTFKIGYAPFGYTVTDGVFSIKEDEAKWVRYIFAETLAGKSSNQIAEALNEKQVPAKRGNHWTLTTVRGIIMNEKYIRDCLFRKTYTDFPLNAGRITASGISSIWKIITSRSSVGKITTRQTRCLSGTRRRRTYYVATESTTSDTPSPRKSSAGSAAHSLSVG